MPDGEVYTSPLETVAEGEIRFTFPALFRGREVEDIRLRFEGGKVVAAEAACGLEILEALLTWTRGLAARRCRVRPQLEIDRFTNNTLFDEKIGGTMHVALGWPSRGSAARTPPRCTGTSSAICGPTARSTPMASWSGGRGASSSSPNQRSSVSDSRLARFADVLVGYSAGVKPGELVLLETPVIVEPLMEEPTGRSWRPAASP